MQMDGRTDRQNYDHQDCASISTSCCKNHTCSRTLSVDLIIIYCISAFWKTMMSWFQFYFAVTFLINSHEFCCHSCPDMLWKTAVDGGWKFVYDVSETQEVRHQRKVVVRMIKPGHFSSPVLQSVIYSDNCIHLRTECDRPSNDVDSWTG